MVRNLIPTHDTGDPDGVHGHWLPPRLASLSCCGTWDVNQYGSVLFLSIHIHLCVRSSLSVSFQSLPLKGNKRMYTVLWGKSKMTKAFSIKSNIHSLTPRSVGVEYHSIPS